MFVEHTWASVSDGRFGQCEQARNRSPNYMADAATKHHGSRGLFSGSRRLKPADAILVLCGRVAVLRCLCWQEKSLDAR